MNSDKISGKERLFKVLRHEPTSSVPWVPYAGVHAGKLKGYTGPEILADGKKLLDALLAVNEVYDPDGQPVLFDLQVEAEILGCEMIWVDEGPPLIGSHPFEGDAKLPTRLPTKEDGRLPSHSRDNARNESQGWPQDRPIRPGNRTLDFGFPPARDGYLPRYGL